MHFVSTVIMISIGIVLMIFSLFLSVKILKMFSSGKMWFSFGGTLKKIWTVLPVFVIFFLTGYIIYFILYLNHSISSFEVIASIIFLAGAVFVLYLTYANYLFFRMVGGKKKV